MELLDQHKGKFVITLCNLYTGEDNYLREFMGGSICYMGTLEQALIFNTYEHAEVMIHAIKMAHKQEFAPYKIKPYNNPVNKE